MSAAKMGEYLEASAPRRERILLDQKFPRPFMSTRYKKAEAVIRAAMLQGGDVVRRVRDERRELRARPTTTPFQETAKRNCLQALRRFSDLYPDLRLADVTVVQGERVALHLRVAGVAISVFPSLVFERVIRGEERSGAVLFVFRKTSALGERAGKATTELLRRALEVAGHENVSPADCLVVDVFGRKVFKATPYGQRVFKEIASACREISVRWPSLSMIEVGEPL